MLLCFGLRLMNNGKLVFIYRIRNYVNPETTESVSIIHLEGDISDAFLFLNMDYEDYKKQKFSSIFEYVSWFTDNCDYLTVDILQGIEKELKGIEVEKRLEEHKALLRFVDTVKVGHIILKDFKYVPIFMYPNLREKIVRNFFCSEELDEKIIDLKLRHLREVEVQNKFSPKLVIHWISSLKSKPELTGLFTTSFVNYITKNNTGVFPRYMVDTDRSILKKEVISYYYNLFPTTKAYKEYVATSKEHNEVD